MQMNGTLGLMCCVNGGSYYLDGVGEMWVLVEV